VKKSLLILPLVLIASALALTACGGGGSSTSSGGGDENAAIEEAIETAATSTDPSKCSEVQTEFFNETETGKTGEAALKTCEKEVEESEDPAESVSISEIELQEGGKGATAVVAIEGGTLNGQSLVVAMENEEDQWKVDGFMGFAKYEPEGIVTAFEEELEKEEAEPEVVSCIGEGIAGWSQEEAEELFIEKEQGGFEELFAECTK
jgi:hypothetical protein